ncbi:MAG: transporter substrate-binding domain-containing protein [Acetilactobacillus jinshanensis]
MHPHYLTIGMSAQTYPYAGRTSSGHLTGFEVDLSKDIAHQMHLKPKFVVTKWAGLISGLGTDKYDAVFNNISVTNQRKKNFRFATPYMYSYTDIVEPNTEHVTNLKQLRGKKVADQGGTDYSLIAQKWHAKLLPVEGDEIIPYLHEGRAKATIASVPNWYGDKKAHQTSGLKMIKVPTSEQKPNSVAPLLNKKSPKLQKKIDKAIKELRKDGTLKRLSIKYFGHKTVAVVKG